MCYAIVINLDHANHTDEVCLEIWESIKDGMIKAGFHLMGRNFSINLPESEAAKRSRMIRIDPMTIQNMGTWNFTKNTYTHILRNFTGMICYVLPILWYHLQKLSKLRKN